MSNVVDFPTNLKYRVLFNLPTGKITKINKGAEDDFDVTISNGHGEAVVPATGKKSASGVIQKCFPSCEIVEVNQL
tara:strand:- start:1151 stop:1378 length:228 start_codon:yes stop_codon:yes gene_type:complete